MTVEIEKSKVSLKGLKSYEHIEPMLMTLSKVYGRWTDQDYRKIQLEIQTAGTTEDAFNNSLEVFNRYFSMYVEFTNKGE